MIDVLTYPDRVVLMVDTPHPCPVCHVMSYMWVQRMGPDSLTLSCLGCDTDTMKGGASCIDRTTN